MKGAVDLVSLRYVGSQSRGYPITPVTTEQLWPEKGCAAELTQLLGVLQECAL